jgi:hypothetical protein
MRCGSWNHRRQCHEQDWGYSLGAPDQQISLTDSDARLRRQVDEAQPLSGTTKGMLFIALEVTGLLAQLWDSYWAQ